MLINYVCSKKNTTITASNDIGHTEPIFKNLNLLKIKDQNVEILFKSHSRQFTSELWYICPKQS